MRRAPIPGPLGRLAARAYGAVITRRNRRFDAGIGVTRLPIPVISVGNLSVGGTGKTPMVMKILERTARGEWARPCVAMRGYRSGGGESDEGGEYARSFPNVPVVAQPDRLSGIRAILATERGRDVRLIVLDDGFQHRRIARDLDIVLLDATRNPFEDRLLPAGWLREPVGSLTRAHVVVITHSEAAAPGVTVEMTRRVMEINRGLRTVVCRHRWAGLRSSLDRENGGAPSDGLPPSHLAGRAVLIACAIGNPGPFISSAQAHIGKRAAGVFLRRDHDPYAPATIRELIAAARTCRAEFILTTEKDWSKLGRAPLADWPCPVLRPRLVLQFDSGASDLARAIAAVTARCTPDTVPQPV